MNIGSFLCSDFHPFPKIDVCQNTNFQLLQATQNRPDIGSFSGRRTTFSSQVPSVYILTALKVSTKTGVFSQHHHFPTTRPGPSTPSGWLLCQGTRESFDEEKDKLRTPRFRGHFSADGDGWGNDRGIS